MIDTERVIKTYRGWDELEKPNDIDIIDFDLIPKIEIERERFNSRENILKQLTELRNSTLPETPDEEFLKARLNASTYYLRALLGEHIPFHDYVENTMGIRPEIIPEVDIKRQKQVVDDLLSEFGVPRRKSFEQFTSEIKLGKQDAENEARRCEEIYVSQVLEILDFGGLEFPHQIQFVEEEAYWMGWTRSLPNGSFELRYNFHPIHQWYKGDLEFMTLHEVGGHFVHAANLKRAIGRNEMNPAIGITMVHDPHPFGGEGIADAISYFLPEIKLSPYGVLAREQRALRDYLQNNAHILINEGGNEDELTAYILDNHHFSTEDKVRLNLKRWVNDPLLRTYQYSYGISSYYHHQWNGQLTKEAKKVYLRYAFTRYATPQQLMKFVEQLK